MFAGYGKLQILEGVNLTAPTEKITVVVGPNGSGKSTLLKSIAGTARVFSGQVEVDGKTISGKSPPEIARAGITYLPQVENVFTRLTVKGNLRISGYIVPKSEFEARVDSALEIFPVLAKYLDTKAVNLSGGERQMLSMAMALIRSPTAVMFDEPTANLSPKISNQVLEIITSITRNLKLTTILVEQNVKRALEIGDVAYLLVSGKVAFSGTCRELLEHSELSRLYLGIQSA